MPHGDRLLAEYMAEAALSRVNSSYADLAAARLQLTHVLKAFQDLPTITALVDFTPTIATINALPEGLRNYIHRLEANCDPAGNVSRIILLEEQVSGLTNALGHPMEESDYDRKQLMLRFIDRRKQKAGDDGESDGDIEGVIVGLIQELAEHMSNSQMTEWLQNPDDEDD